MHGDIEEVRHVGEIVAVVVAETVAAAKDAAELVAVDYEPLPAVIRAARAAAPDAPHARRDGGNICLDGEVGDPAATDAAFARRRACRHIDTWVQRVAGVPMEPRAAVGEYDPDERNATRCMPGAGGAVSRSSDLAWCSACRSNRCAW